MTTPAGTANILRQHTDYSQLRQDYSPEVASVLAQKSLERHNIPASPSDVEVWHRINTAAADSKLDIATERRVAEARADAVTAHIVDAARSSTAVAPVTADHSAEAAYELDGSDDNDDDSDGEPEDDEGELASGADLFGYENDEDNAEAAYDEVLKIQENAD